jgi:hypothetical protein
MAKLAVFTPGEAGLQAILDLLRFTGAIQLSVPDGNQEPKVVEPPRRLQPNPPSQPPASPFGKRPPNDDRVERPPNRRGARAAGLLSDGGRP